MAQEIDDFLVKVGTDKVLHFLSGALICAFITLVVLLQDAVSGWVAVAVPLVGTLFAVFLALFKELALDTGFDKKDVLATALGSLPIFLATLIGVAFHELSC